VIRGIIAAVSPEGAIGVDGQMPWHYSEDLKRFKRLTMGATVIMGRLTWESLSKRPLPGRRNIVITRRRLEGVECFPSLEAALATCEGDVWFIGGTRIFEEAMKHADLIDLAYVPDSVTAEGAVFFPEIPESDWEAGPLETHPDDPRLKHRVYTRRRRGKSDPPSRSFGGSAVARRAEAEERVTGPGGPDPPRAGSAGKRASEERATGAGGPDPPRAGSAGKRASEEPASIVERERSHSLSESKSQRHQSVTAPELPKVLGPYSPGVVLGDLVFVSGQGAVDPKTGKLAGSDVESQTEQVFRNIEAILTAAGSGLDKIVRCGVFLADIKDFPKMNAVYERMMAGNRPVRTTVQAAALPMEGLKVEIDAIAYR
jgi:2-iminobutanoate/2-iminopropanoate deaminase